jgi:hypothetical protein
MKITIMLRITGIAVAAGMLAACPGDRDQRTDAADVPAVEVGPGVGQETVQAMPTPERVVMQGGGVMAEAVISPMQGATHVVLDVHQAPANTTLQAAVHQGQCGTPGAQVASLGPVTTSAAGAGRGEAHLNVPAHLVFDGQHHIQLHGGGAAAAQPGAQPGMQPGAGAMTACADIPAREMPRTEAGAPAPAGQQAPGQQPGAQQPPTRP